MELTLGNEYLDRTARRLARAANGLPASHFGDSEQLQKAYEGEPEPESD